MLIIFRSTHLSLTDILLLLVLFIFCFCMLMYYKHKSKEMSKMISLQTGSPSHLDSIFSSKLWFIYKFHDERKICDIPKLNSASVCSMLFLSNSGSMININGYLIEEECVGSDIALATIKHLEMEHYTFVLFPKITSCIYAKTITNSSVISTMLCPAHNPDIFEMHANFKEFQNKKNICAHPFMKIHFKDSVCYISPLSKQRDYYIRECSFDYTAKPIVVCRSRRSKSGGGGVVGAASCKNAPALSTTTTATGTTTTTTGTKSGLQHSHHQHHQHEASSTKSSSECKYSIGGGGDGGDGEGGGAGGDGASGAGGGGPAASPRDNVATHRTTTTTTTNNGVKCKKSVGAAVRPPIHPVDSSSPPGTGSPSRRAAAWGAGLPSPASRANQTQANQSPTTSSKSSVTRAKKYIANPTFTRITRSKKTILQECIE